MAAIEIGTIRDTVAAYLKMPLANFIINGVDTLTIALNNARRTAERGHDFNYSQTNLNLVIASTGTDINTAVDPVSGNIIGIKRIQNVSLPVIGGVLPIEFLSNDDWNARLRRQLGRMPYNPNMDFRQLGIANQNPVCYQQGQSLFLVPSTQFTFPITAQLSVVQWMPDYVNNTDTDFFVQYAPEYLQWQAMLEGNKLWEVFVERVEGKLTEANLQTFASSALGALLEWDRSISDGTSMPKQPPAQ